MFDIHNLMADLAQHRPIFHSEADFQHALAWQIHETMPDCKIRLEWPYRKKNWHLDIWLSIPKIAIELKYRTKKLELKHDGEVFALSNQGAYDFGEYDYLKDIQRLEWVVADSKSKAAFGVLLTNDPRYWDPPKGESWKETTDADFRLHQDRKVTGKLAWFDETAESTKQGREDPICLTGSYHLHWRDYSSLEKKNDRQIRNAAVTKKKSSPRYRGLGLRRKRTDHLFRYLAVSVLR